jgi:signal recognition particle receptor subunit beta
MAKVSREAGEVNARIVYWGIDGAGKSTNLRAAYSKLRPDHRGEIREVASRLDPTVSYPVLPISLGEVAGVRTQIELIAVPGHPEQAPTRKQLLDQVDGVVLVVDAAPGRVDDNVASFRELRQILASYGRSLGQVPLVVQYNKRDLADPYAVEDLHRKLDPGDAQVFEAVATEGSAVMETLSTISKRVIRNLRDQGVGPGAAPAAAPATVPPPAAPPHAEPTLVDTPQLSSPTERMEQAILEEEAHPEAAAVDVAARNAEALLETSWEDLSGEIRRPAGARLGRDLCIVSVGEASRAGDRSVRLPLVLGDAEGETSTVVLTIQLDALVEEDPG